MSNLYPKVFFIALGFATSHAISADLVTNGSFELGQYVPSSNDTTTLPIGSTAMSGWIVTTDLIAWIGSANPWSLTANEGNFFLDLTDFAVGLPFGGVSQNITTNIGQSYELSFDLGSSTKWGASAIEVSAAGSSKVFASNVATALSDWDRFSMIFTAYSETTTISLTGVSGDLYIGLDNVSVHEIPTLDPDELLTIFPPSAKLGTTYRFDLGLIVETGIEVSVNQITHATLDSVLVTDVINDCVIPGTLVSVKGESFRCPDVVEHFLSAGVSIGAGTHVFCATVKLSDDTSVTDCVTWEILANTE